LDELNKLKAKVMRGLNEKLPSNIDLAMHATAPELKALKNLLTIKPSRVASGVTVCAVMTKPSKCPHGKCVYCPGGMDSFFGDTPQSYTGHEPAALRARRNDFDAYLQVFNRLEQYASMNKPIDKIELIVMGGTFLAMPPAYQNSFVSNALKALNDFSELFYPGNSLDLVKFKEFFELPGSIHDPERVERINKKIRGLKAGKKITLAFEQERNESSHARNVAFCIESRPDYCREKHIKRMLELGATRAELGVQSIHDSVLNKIGRMHSVKDSSDATQLLKDSFLKVAFHMMPGLPSSTKEKDIGMFKELFSNPDFMPDALKIYPCLVLEGTKLFDEWKQGRFKPLTTKQAIGIIVASKKFIPRWCRVMRVQRDIPSNLTVAGPDKTNLRQMVHEEMRKKGIECDCIRCREPKNKAIDLRNLKLSTESYEASNGVEKFISVESRQGFLLGFCRLRKPFKPFLKGIGDRTLGIRELHVYGSAEPLGEKSIEGIQHKGIGKALLAEAERIALEEFDARKLVVLSGIGARHYYRMQGYKRNGFFMQKIFN
jgi:elongator complex protein 3